MSLLSKVFKKVKGVASVANPLAGVGYDLVGGKGAKEAGRNFVGNSTTKAKGAMALAPLALGGAGGGLPGGMGGGGGAGASASMAGGGGGGGRFSLGGMGLGDLFTLGTGALGAYQGAKDMSRGQKQQQQAMDLAMGEWNKDDPLRNKRRELAMMDIPEREDLSSLYQGTGNPFAAPPPGVQAGGGRRLSRAFRGG